MVDARFVKPLDAEAIVGAAQRTGRVITVEENNLAGGFGSAVLQLLQARRLDDVRVSCLGIPDEFVEHASQAFLRARYGLDAPGIASPSTRRWSNHSPRPAPAGACLHHRRGAMIGPMVK